MQVLGMPTIRLAVITVAASMLVSACGGSGSSNEPIAKERINGVEVPPAPDAVANAATLKGVDVDGNGLRDDIDRQLATVFGTDAATHALAVRFSRTEQAALAAPSPAAIEAHVREVSCIRDRAILAELSKVTRSTLDTPQRARAYASAFAGAGATLGSCP